MQTEWQATTYTQTRSVHTTQENRIIFYLAIKLSGQRELGGVVDESNGARDVLALQGVGATAADGEVGQQGLHVRHGEVVTTRARVLELRGGRLVAELQLQRSALLLAAVLLVVERRKNANKKGACDENTHCQYWRTTKLDFRVMLGATVYLASPSMLKSISVATLIILSSSIGRISLY